MICIIRTGIVNCIGKKTKGVKYWQNFGRKKMESLECRLKTPKLPTYKIVLGNSVFRN